MINKNLQSNNLLIYNNNQNNIKYQKKIMKKDNYNYKNQLKNINN